MTFVRLAALWLTLAACLSCGSSALNIGILVFPETGHLNPLLAIVEAASVKGHTTVVFGPEFFMKSCNREISSLPFAKCVNLGFYNTSEYNDAYMERLVQMDPLPSLEEINKHAMSFNSFLATSLKKTVERDAIHLDVLLVDFGAWAGTAVGDVMGIPSVVVWPLTLQFPIETSPSIPSLGTALPQRMTWRQRMWNYFVQRVFLAALSLVTEGEYNSIRALVGAPPVDIFDLYYRRTIITPSVFGLDIGQPLCPNVNPVGFLSRLSVSSDLSSAEVPEEWMQFMDKCTNGIVYINMGSIAILPDAWVHRIEQAAVKLSTVDDMCVVWKLTKRQFDVVEDAQNAPKHRMRLTHHVPFSPRLLLNHSHASVFVTHCGDTSVYEAVRNRVPMVGIALFADQADMCARIADAGVGLALNKRTFTNTELYDSIHSMRGELHDAAMKKLRVLKNMGKVLGGATRAAEILEMVALNPDIYHNFFCEHVRLPWYQRHDVDCTCIMAALLFVVLAVMWWVLKGILRLLCCSRRGAKVKRE